MANVSGQAKAVGSLKLPTYALYSLPRGPAGGAGYVRGPLFPGEWNVMLGVDRIQPEGAQYEVTVTLKEDDTEDGRWKTEDNATPTPRHSALGTRHSARWLKGDLHCHTLHSDGL